MGVFFLATALLRAAPTTSTPAAGEAPVEDHDQSPRHLALIDYKRGDFAKAETEVEAAEQAAPDDIGTGLLHARILTELGRYAEGEKVLQRLLDAGGTEAREALGDLRLRKRDFEGATVVYVQALQAKGDDADLLLKLVYARVSLSDFVTAGKFASELKPLDPDRPCYYFAEAALDRATGKTEEADQEIETARTIYGITETNRYLKVYLEVMEGGGGKG